MHVLQGPLSKFQVLFQHQIIEFDSSQTRHRDLDKSFLQFAVFFFTHCARRDLEVLLLKYAIDDIGMHFFYVLFPLALESTAVVMRVLPILSKY